MKKHIGSVFVVSVSFIFLLSISLFLSSCGQNTPGGTPSVFPKQIPAKSPIIAPLILLSASSTANDNITIKLTGEAGKVYHLYMTDNINAQASTTVHLPDSTTYTLTLDPAKTYYFILGVVGANGKEHGSGAYVTSKPGTNGQYRENIVMNPPIPATKSQTPQNNNLGINGYMFVPGGSYVSVQYNNPDGIGLSLEDMGVYNYALHVVEPTGGHYMDSRNFEYFLGISGGHPEIKIVPIPCVINGLPDTCDSYQMAYYYSDYNAPLVGHKDWDDGRYRNNHANGTFDISLVYDGYGKPFGSFYGTPVFIYRVNVCGNTVKEGYISLEASTIGTNGYITPPIKVTAPAQCPGTNDRTLSSILVEPPKATIYIHPTNPASASQQYKATGTYTDGATEDITSNVLWHSSKPDIATIDMTGLAALPAPISLAKPGSTAIWATSTMTANPAFPLPSNGAELCVECREYTHYRQNVGAWKDQVFANHTDNGKFIARLGLYEFSVGHISCHTSAWAIALSSMGFSINPGELDTYLKNPEINGYKDNVPVEAALYEFARGIITSISGWKAGTLPDLKQEIIAELQKCNIVIAEVGGKNGGFLDHYITVIKEENGEIKIYDTWFNNGDPDLDYLTTRYYLKAYRTIITK